MAVSVHDGRGRPGLGAPDGDDVTRYLCAAAYLDPRFARDVLDELLLEPGRGFARCLGPIRYLSSVTARPRCGDRCAATCC